MFAWLLCCLGQQVGFPVPDGGAGQLVFRPIPGLARAGTPVSRLYLASASAHPGGGVHGAAGANAARAALAADHRPRRLIAVGAAGALLAGGTRLRGRRTRPCW